MKKRKPDTPIFSDIERPHPTIADSLGDVLGAEPLPVRLGHLWTDFVRDADEARDPERPKDTRNRGEVPILDEMKGILQWD